jgi:sec-independent protein translocase protein TatB
MFDVGFWELGLIMVVALLVIGPERMPGLARKAGILLGKGRKFIRSVKADIDQEIAAEELKRVLKEHSDATGLHEIIEETRDTVNEVKQDYMLKSVKDTPAASESSENPPADTDSKSLTENDPAKQ